jgi:hypothetical protein
MNDLDDLIRGSLDTHAPAVPPDDTLADRVGSAGRRIRRNRRIGIAALALALIAGLAAGLPGLTGASAPIAATPSVAPTGWAISSPTAPSSPSPSTTLVRPTWDPTATTRDVSAVGEQIEYAAAGTTPRQTRANFFASPSGKFWCTISTEFANCNNTVEMPGIEPTRTELGCDDTVVAGVEVNSHDRGSWYCSGDQNQFPQLNDADGSGMSIDGTLWWDAEFGQTRPGLGDPRYTLAVLPYGKTLIAGDFSCTTATTGVTCTNTRTHHGFRISQSAVKLF